MCVYLIPLAGLLLLVLHQALLPESFYPLHRRNRMIVGLLSGNEII